MATIAIASVERLLPGGILVVWEPLPANGDDGAPFEWVHGMADISVQSDGTFGTGGACAWQGSIDGTTWWALTNRGTATATSFTAANGNNINGTPRFIRPRLTAGTGTIAIVGRACFMRARPA